MLPYTPRQRKKLLSSTQRGATGRSPGNGEELIKMPIVRHLAKAAPFHFRCWLHSVIFLCSNAKDAGTLLGTWARGWGIQGRFSPFMPRDYICSAHDLFFNSRVLSYTCRKRKKLLRKTFSRLVVMVRRPVLLVQNLSLSWQVNEDWHGMILLFSTVSGHKME